MTRRSNVFLSPNSKRSNLKLLLVLQQEAVRQHCNKRVYRGASDSSTQKASCGNSSLARQAPK